MPTLSPFINPAVNYGTDAQDYTAEAQSLQRKRSVSDALLKRSFDPISVPVAKDNNQLSSVISPFAAVAKLGETYLANKAGENVDSAETGLASRYKAAENKAISDFTQGDTNDTKHLLKYAQSQFPTVRAAALEMLKEQQKGVIRPKDAFNAHEATVPSRVAAATTGDLTKLEQKPESHTVAEGGTLVSTTPGDPSKTSTMLDKGKQYATNPDGSPLIIQRKDENGHIADFQLELGTKQLVPIDKSNKTNVRVDTHVAGQKARTQLEEEASKALSSSYDRAQSAVQSISTSHVIRKSLEDDASLSGTAAGPRARLLRIADSLGIGGKTTEEKLAATSARMQALAQAELDASGQMKGQGQITENERLLLRRTAEGDIGNTSEEIMARVNAVEKAARFRMKRHEDSRQRYTKAYPDVETEFFHLNEPDEYKTRSEQHKASTGNGMARPPTGGSEFDQYKR